MARNSRLGLGRRKLIAFTGGLLAAPAIVRAQGGKGVALVIGNSKYQWESSLPNAKRDSSDIAKAFQAMGLKTELLENAGRQATLGALDRLQSAIQPGAFAAFYFAGHGVTLGDSAETFTPFVVPADADLSDPSAAKSLVSTNTIARAMSGAAGGLRVFDSCRNNPADGWKQKELAQFAGATRENASVGASLPNTLTLFSTAPGYVALDGPAGQNSPFAAALLDQLEAPSIDLQALPAKLRRDLLIATDGRQILADQNRFAQPFVLSGKSAGRGKATGLIGDPSRLIELPNTYAYLRQSGLLLPAGLVAIKAASDQGANRMLGAFKVTYPDQTIAILIVLSVEGNQVAQVIQAAKSRQGRMGWRLIRGTISGNSLEYLQQDQTAFNVFDWKGADSGNAFSRPAKNTMGQRISATPGYFTRLD